MRLRNIHCYSDSKVSFDNAVYDQTSKVELRQREFAWLNVSGNQPRVSPKKVSQVLDPGASVEKLMGGFYNISGGAIDPAGDYYFVDAHWQRIYRWSAQTKQLSTVSDSPLDPVQVVFDKAGNLMVISYAGQGTVYTLRLPSPGGGLTLLKAEASVPRPGMTAVLPVDHWRLENDFFGAVPVKKPYQFVSPDGTTFIRPAKTSSPAGCITDRNCTMSCALSEWLRPYLEGLFM